MKKKVLALVSIASSSIFAANHNDDECQSIQNKSIIQIYTNK